MPHRPKRPRRPRPAHPAPNLRGLFRQPKPTFYRLPELEIRGGIILTEGCRKVLDFDPQRLCLDMGRFVVTFYGQALRIESLNGKRAVVTGRVARIEFAPKWAQSGEVEDGAL